MTEHVFDPLAVLDRVMKDAPRPEDIPDPTQPRNVPAAFSPEVEDTIKGLGIPTAAPAAPQAAAPVLGVSGKAPAIDKFSPEVEGVLAGLGMAEKPGFLEEFGKGLLRGGPGVGSNITATVGALLDSLGAPESAREFVTKAIGEDEELAQRFPQAVSFEDAFESFPDFLLFAGAELGEQLPNIATIIGLALGAGFGAPVARAAVVSIGRSIGARVARGELKGEVAKRVLNETGRIAFSQRAAKIGAFAGATALETGGIVKEQLISIDDIVGPVALGFGAVAGYLETLTPLALAAKAGIGPNIAGKVISRAIAAADRFGRNRLGRAATIGLAGAAGETFTEGLQEVVAIAARDVVDEDFSSVDPARREEIISRITESMVVGGLVGGGISTPVGFVAGPLRVAPDVGKELEEAEAALVGDVAPAVAIARPITDGAETRYTPETITIPGGPKIVRFQRSGDIVSEILTNAEAQQVQPDFDINNLVQFKVNLDALDPDNVTADLLDLPGVEALTVDNPSVTLLVPETAEEALAAAVDAVLQANTLDPNEARQARLTYLNAIKLGFRFEPEANDSFIVVGEQAFGEFIEHRGPLDIDPDRSTQGITSRSFLNAKGGFLAVQTLVGRAAGISPTERKKGIFHVDLRRVPRSQIFGGTVQDILDLLPEEVLVSQEAFETAVEIVPELSFVADITEEQRKRIFKVISETEAETTKTSKSFALQELGKPGLRFFNPRLKSDLVIIGELDLRALSRVPVFPSAQKQAHIFRGEDARRSVTEVLKSVETLNEKAYKEEDQELGTVVVVAQDPQDLTGVERDRATKVASIYQDLMKRFKMTDRRLVLVVNGFPTDSQLSMGPSTAGYFHGPTGGVTNIIALKLDNTFWVTNAAHEFGHFVLASEVERMDGGVRRGLLSAYNRALVKSLIGKGTTDFTLEFGAAETAEGFGALTFTGNVGSAADLLEARTRTTEYWLNFDEWFAQQMARYVTTDAVPLGFIEKVVAGFGRKIMSIVKEIKDTLGIKGAVFEPTEEFRELIRRLEARERPSPIYGDVMLTQDGVEAQVATVVMGPSEVQGVENSETTFHVDRALKALGINNKLRRGVRATTDRFNKFLKYAITLPQLARLNPDILGLQIYRETVERWHNERLNTIARGDETIRDWSKRGPEQADRIGRVLFEVDAMTYLTRQEVEDGVTRHPTQDELVAIFKKHKLVEEDVVIYERILGDFTFIVNKMEEAAIADISALLPVGSVELEVEIAGIKLEFRTLRARPYFPHMRFGDFAVLVKDDKNRTVFFAQFDRKGDAIAAARRVKAKFPASAKFTTSVDAIPKEVRTLAGLPTSVLKRLKSRLKLSDQQEEWLDNYIAENLPSRSFATRLLRRRNIAGFSANAMQAYASYFFHGSGYLARLKFGGPLADSINFMKDEKRELRERLTAEGEIADTTKRSQIIEYVNNHFAHIMDPKPDWAQLRAVAFNWHLGFNPKSAFINLTQVPVVTWPFLSAQFGNIKALNALRKASIEFNRSWARTRSGEDARGDWFFDAVNVAMTEGFLDESMAKELAEMAEGSNLKRMLPGNAGVRTLRMISHYGAYMFQTAEKYNRSITFRAAVDLAMADPEAKYLAELEVGSPLQFDELRNRPGWDAQKARAFLAGKDAVNVTQFNYQQWARPRFMRGKLGTLFTFFMFKQNLLFFAATQPGRGRFLLMMLFMAGIMGLPGAEDMADIAKVMARWRFGKDFDLEGEVREFVLQVLGEDPAVPPDIILHGISRVGFGLPAAADLVGIPLPRFDLSGSLGQGQFVPGLSELVRGGDFNQAFARATTDIAGAAFGIGIGVVKALSDSDLPVDDFKRWERAAPAGLRNISRAYRFATEGRERTRTGATVVDFDITDAATLSEAVRTSLEIAGVAAGFQPTRISQLWNREIFKRERVQFWQIRKEMLMLQFDQSNIIPAGPVRKEVLAAIRRYNKEVAFPALRIRPQDLRASLRNRILQRKMFELGISGPKRAIPASRVINRLFPEVETPGQSRVEDIENVPK